MKISKYSLLPLIYLLLNIKLASLGESFPITFATFTILFLMLYVETINVKKLVLALSIIVFLITFNKYVGRALDPQKYLTSLLLFVYVGFLFSILYSCGFSQVNNINKITRNFRVILFVIVIISVLEVVELLVFKSSRLIALISGVLIYSNEYLLNILQYGALRSNSLYFEPAFFSLVLLSIWLCLKQADYKSRTTDLLVFVGLFCSGSFSGLMTFIIFLIVDGMLKVSNSAKLKKKITYALVSLIVLAVLSYFILPYLISRISDLGVIGTSSYYRVIGPLKIVENTLSNLDGMIQFGSVYRLVSSFQLLNGTQVGKTLDNGIYVLIVHFSWLALIAILAYILYLFKVIAVALRSPVESDSSLVLLLIFIPLSLMFTGAIFSPEYAFALAAPFIIRKIVPFKGESND